jgi:2-polyprenyl-3-methyl-5-hydroxy-6-metoxy-1,4-benzoquinol methylase
MSRNKDEQAAAEWFRDRYGCAPSDAALDLERTVIGGDFGANGYTTIGQADLIAKRLHLRAGDRLLDVGSGRGWPGLYLAKGTDCSVVLSDLPEEGLRTARHRADVEGVSGRATVVVASARRLPFAHETFDAIVHTDVLC